MACWSRVIILAFLGCTISCRRSPELVGGPSAPPSGTNQQVFQVKGVVRSVNLQRRQVEIRHEEIPGYMPAMTMPFDVKYTNELAGLQPGQPVTFRLIVTDTDGWIDKIQKLESTATNGPPQSSSLRRVRDVDPLSPGDPLPEYSFTNQFGQIFNTSGFKGQALALTFLFTRCPYPTFCPRMAANFEEAQQKMLGDAQSPTNWHLLTISFDPEFDSPAVLKAYAEARHYDPRHWTFATGALTDVTAITEQFGLAFWRDPPGSISHNLRTAVIDANGRVRKIFEGNTWTSDELISEIRKAAFGE